MIARGRMGFARNMEGDRGVRREVARGGIMTVYWFKLVLFARALTSAGYARTSRPGAPAREWFRVLDGLQLDQQQRAGINRIRRELRRARGSPGARPDVEAYQPRIWGLLDDAHRARMRSKLTEARGRIARGRAGDGRPPAASRGSVELDEAGRRRLAFLGARQARRRRTPRRKGIGSPTVRREDPRGTPK